jgi:hypothetical protein
MLKDHSLRQQLGIAAAEISRKNFAPEPRLNMLIQYLLAAST